MVYITFWLLRLPVILFPRFITFLSEYNKIGCHSIIYDIYIIYFEYHKDKN